MDKAGGLFAHPDKVHRREFNGRYLQRVALYGAPLATGPSGRDPGRVLRARQGILGALGGNGVRRAHDLTAAKREYRSFKGAVVALERNPEKVTFNTIAWPVVAEARTEAEDRIAVIGSFYKEVDGLSLLSEALNFDFKTKGMDEPSARRSWRECPGCKRCATESRT